MPIDHRNPNNVKINSTIYSELTSFSDIGTSSIVLALDYWESPLASFSNRWKDTCYRKARLGAKATRSVLRSSILILDPYFDAPTGIQGIWKFLEESPPYVEVKILVSKQNCIKSLQEWLKIHSTEHSIDIKLTALEFHDRFAALDAELWHFGSTVGGAYPQFSAVTRGWSAADFRDVFYKLWRKSL